MALRVQPGDWLEGPFWQGAVAARRLGDQHWLYIVRLGDGMLWMIRDPYHRLQPRELKRWVVQVRDASGCAETAQLGAPS